MGLVHLCTGDGHQPREVDMTRLEQSSDEQQVEGVDGPHDFTLVDGGDVVDLHPYVAGGVGTVEYDRFAVLDLDGRPFGNTHIDLARGEPSQRLQPRFEVAHLVFQHKGIVGGQRGRVECRHEDVARSRVGVGDNVVGTLLDKCKRARLQQQRLQVACLHRVGRYFTELDGLLCGVGLDGDLHHLAPFAALYGNYLAAYGRSDHYIGERLVVHDWRTGQNLVARFDVDLGSQSRKIVGDNGV